MDGAGKTLPLVRRIIIISNPPKTDTFYDTKHWLMVPTLLSRVIKYVQLLVKGTDLFLGLSLYDFRVLVIYNHA